MTTATKIEWTDMTLNPGIYGCEAASPACAHCYAAGMAHRLAAMGAPGYAGVTRRTASGVHWTGKVRVDCEAIGPAFARLPGPRAPKRVFVTSMADLFHWDVPDDFLMRVFEAMAARPWHTFQVLTKRPERAAAWWRGPAQRPGAEAIWPSNVWIGTTVEDQARADERIPHLLWVPARVRFVSCEPLLGPVDLRRIHHDRIVEIDALTGDHGVLHPLAGRSDARLHWIIAGGESGPHARPTHPDWARSLRDQATAAGVPFFFKGWGEWAPIRNDSKGDQDALDASLRTGAKRAMAWPDGEVSYRLGKKAAGRLLDGRTWDEVPT